MICPNCERYKASASMWRNKAYEASGHPLPWKPDELWVGLTDEDKASFFTADQMTNEEWQQLYADIEAKLKEKNT